MVDTLPVRPPTNKVAVALKGRVIGYTHTHLVAEALAQYEIGESDVSPGDDNYLVLLQETMEEYELPNAALETVEFGDPPQWIDEDPVTASCVSITETVPYKLFTAVSDVEGMNYDYFYIALFRSLDLDDPVFGYEDTMEDREAYLAQKFSDLGIPECRASECVEPDRDTIADEEAVS